MNGPTKKSSSKSRMPPLLRNARCEHASRFLYYGSSIRRIIELKLVRKPPKVSRGYGGAARLPVQPGSPDFRVNPSYNIYFWVCPTSPDRAWSGIEHLWEFWPWRGSFRCDIYSAWSGIGHLWEFQKTFLSCDFDGGVADILWSHSVQKT